MQNTGHQGWSQGGGDLDRLVAPGDAPAAVAVLHQLGFSSPPGMFSRQLRSVWGRYARWAGHELSLHRPGKPLAGPALGSQHRAQTPAQL